MKKRAILWGAGFAFIAHLTLAFNQTASAENKFNKNSKVVSYKIADGYGEYVGHGPTRTAASSEARTQCVMKKVEAYEKSRGQTPDEDTVDLYFDACINR